MKIIILSCIIILILFVVISRVLELYFDKDYYGYPAVTKCGICNKTVWQWQRHERREMKVDSNYSGMSASGIVHKKCKGVATMKVNVEIR